MINIGSRRELLCDNYLINTRKTTVSAIPQKPVKREVAFVHDKMWESRGAVYHNIVNTPDGRMLMYYKSNYHDKKPDGMVGIIRRICVIESTDGGRTWSRPEFTITPLEEKAPVNNIISGLYDYYDNLFVFYDTNPKCPENERYKAIYGEWGTGIFGYKSADGIHFDFHPEKDENGSDHTMLISGADSGCYFDSLNTVYFNNNTGKYVAFVRGFHCGDDLYPPDPDVPEAVRDIRYMESKDFKKWSYPVPFKYNDDYDYQLYANAITPYYRAPHMFVANPTRYIAKPEWNDSFDNLPAAEERRNRPRGKSLNDAIFMSSRDCKKWFRYPEAVFTPGPEHTRNWAYGDCYPCVGMVETPNEIEGADPYLSLFCKEDHDGEPTKLYRYTLRMDGFVARRATVKPQKLVTKSFIYEGNELEINFETSAVGYLKIKIKDENGNEAISDEIFGDKIDRKVAFKDNALARFSGKSVVMEIEMSDASLYSFKFNKK